ncbi:Retinoid isomerohydrolase like protein [Argiope bruennichi]|uniref:Retinoid isomerohydrolase like protein n=1 Tax=Argiope bruennichi TaxID=94029 RepID=A0A8T0EBV8_ARGBR|nr:Retinoid isomerohydrolase like protein [Argiope bruennichi]
MSRFLDTVAYNKVCQVKRPVFVEFGTKAYPDQEKNVFSRYLSHLVPLELSDNVMANVFIIDDELYASSETCHVWKINPTNLKCEKRIDLRDLVSVNLASSHPHICPDGSVYNLCASFMTGLRYHVMKLNPRKLPAGEKGFERGASIMTTISSSQKTTYSYYHSFALSENYILFLKQPLLVNTVKMAASGIKGYCVRDCLEWTPTMKEGKPGKNLVTLKDTQATAVIQENGVIFLTPETKGEAGVLLSVVLDVADGTRDFLMVIHAKTFEELGRAYIPRSVKLPPSVHARFRMH